MCPDCQHWKANHDEMVARNKLLRDRPDLPLERLEAYRRVEARIASLTAEVERLKAEVDDARCYIATDDGSKLHIRNLIRCGLRHLKRKGRGVFWARVADAYGVGSTSAHRLCRFVQLDPDTGDLIQEEPDHA